MNSNNSLAKSASALRWRSKPVVFLLLVLPFLFLLQQIFTGQLGPDPAEALSRQTGEWAIRMLFLTLLMTPLRRFTGKPLFVQHRRMIGLFAFFYALLHVLTFFWLYTAWQLSALLEEFVQRPYITVGLVAFIILCLLALTSPHAARRRLKRNWQRLHKFVYVAALLTVTHVWWQSRSDLTEAVVYAVILLLLMIARVPRINRAH